MRPIALSRTTLDFTLNPDLPPPSARQAPFSAFALTFPLQNLTLQQVRTKLHSGMPALVTPLHPAFLTSLRSQSYQKVSKQLSLEPFQIPASASPVLKGNRHDYLILLLNTILQFRQESSIPIHVIFPCAAS